MSLFICSKCSCVENTALAWRSDIKVPNGYPDLGMMEMYGEGEDKTIQMICSECNQGHWHGEFEKRQATEREKTIAKYSKYGMITKYDHPIGLLVKADNDNGYELSPLAIWCEQNNVLFTPAIHTAPNMTELASVKPEQKEFTHTDELYLKLADLKRAIKDVKKNDPKNKEKLDMLIYQQDAVKIEINTSYGISSIPSKINKKGH